MHSHTHTRADAYVRTWPQVLQAKTSINARMEVPELASQHKYAMHGGDSRRAGGSCAYMEMRVCKRTRLHARTRARTQLHRWDRGCRRYGTPAPQKTTRAPGTTEMPTKRGHRHTRKQTRSPTKPGQTLVPATQRPTDRPTGKPTMRPTDSPTGAGTMTPQKKNHIHTPPPRPPGTFSPIKTISPTPVPTQRPTQPPTAKPSQVPTQTTTDDPTYVPSITPTASPSRPPSKVSTVKPTTNPTKTPTSKPTKEDTSDTWAPTYLPTRKPTPFPTFVPSSHPSIVPSELPSFGPTRTPTHKPTTAVPTANPTNVPTHTPTSHECKPPPSAAAVKKEKGWYDAYRGTHLMQCCLRKSYSRGKISYLSQDICYCTGASDSRQLCS